MILQKALTTTASISKLWAYLTEADKTKQYMFGCEVLSSWEVGTPVIWQGQTEDGKEIIYVKGELIKIEPLKVLQFTMFDPNMGLEDLPHNYILLTYTLSEKKGQTILQVEQGDYSKVDNGQSRLEESEKGWDYVLPLLKELVERETT